MTAGVATFVVLFGILGLFWLDRERRSKTSKALWIPAVWVWIAGSRSVTQWLSTLSGTSITDVSSNADVYLEGNPLDRNVFIALLVLGAVILFFRRRRLGRLLAANGPLLLFFAYCGFSTLWSDYTSVSLKRWTKDIGDLVMVLVVLTDLNPFSAVKKILGRTAFVLIPASVLCIKYYPDLGRGYHPFTWTPYYTGVTLNKNELGYICLIFGLASVWRILLAFRREPGPRRLRLIIAHCSILAMVGWLFWMANSMTSFSCFIMASAIMIATSLPWFSRRPWTVHVMVALMLGISFSTLFLDMGSSILETMGRDPTLTGRTDIWKMVLNMTTSPLMGTGYESFWLGQRLDQIWSIYWWHPREAHNGYIEVYINLGLIGIGILLFVLTRSYQNVIAAFQVDPDSGKLRIAYFVVAVAYNFTESAIRMLNPVWIFFLLAAVVVPGGWKGHRPKKVSIKSKVELADLQPVASLEEA
jgi:exopolysaccharide production protein ExoQ